MRAAIATAVLAFFGALGFFYVTEPAAIARYGVLGSARTSFYLALLAGGAIYAWLRGGMPERAVATILVSDVLLDPVFHLVLAKRFTSVDPTHLALGLIYLAAFVAIALRVDRLWTLWLCAFHGLSVLSHATKALDIHIHPVIYAVMQVVWSYAMLGLLILGTWNFQRRLRMKPDGAFSTGSSHR